MDDKDEDFSIEQDEDLDDSVVAEANASESIKKLRTRLRESEAKAREYLDGWQRSQAEFANLRKKDEVAREEFVKFAHVGLVKELIPILDSFNIAISQGHEDLSPISSQLLKVLKDVGLEEVDPMGEEFDPHTSEAISMKMVEREEEDHQVLEVAQKGYSLSGKIIRPAKVIIGEYNG